MFTFWGHPYTWLNSIHCFIIGSQLFCLKCKAFLRKFQNAFPAFLAIIGKNLGIEEIVASLGNRGKCSKDVRGRHKQTLPTSPFFSRNISPHINTTSPYILACKVSFTWKGIVKTKLNLKINSMLKEIGLWVKLERSKFTLKYLVCDYWPEIFAQCPQEHEVVVS